MATALGLFVFVLVALDLQPPKIEYVILDSSGCGIEVHVSDNGDFRVYGRLRWNGGEEKLIFNKADGNVYIVKDLCCRLLRERFFILEVAAEDAWGNKASHLFILDNGAFSFGVLLDPRAVYPMPPAEVVEKLKRAGVSAVDFNFVAHDKPWQGYAFYNSSFLAVYPGWNVGYTYRLYKALKDAGFKVYAWLPIFRNSYLWKNHPEFRAKRATKQGVLDSPDYFLSPSNPNVRSIALKVIRELLEEFQGLDGISLDYFRYNEDFESVDNYSVNSFREWLKSRYGISILAEEIVNGVVEGSNWKFWTQWCEFKSEVIASFVEETVSSVRELRSWAQVRGHMLPFPFISGYYSWTVAGYDPEKVAKKGLHPIVMVYSEWAKDSNWYAKVLRGAANVTKTYGTTYSIDINPILSEEDIKYLYKAISFAEVKPEEIYILIYGKNSFKSFTVHPPILEVGG